MTPSSSTRISVRLAPLGLAVVLLASACVSIDPIPSGSPTPAVPRQTPTGQPNATPAPTTPGTEPTPTAPDATLEPGATPTPTLPGASVPPMDPALAAQIDAVVEAMPPIRELETLADVPYQFISQEQFTADLTELQNQAVPAEAVAAEERFYKRMGLLPDDANLADLTLALISGSALAYYRFDTKSFYIVEEGEQELSATDKISVAHEYTHALQDQHFEVGANRITDLSQTDAALGQLAAAEGDATLAMQQWTQGNLSPDEAFEVLLESLEQLMDPTLSNTPWILRRQLEFPYAEGFSFAQGLYDQGGWDAVNASLSTAIPASTEQVLHPDKYLANEAPVVITLPDQSSEMNQGEGSWSLSYQQTLGELLMQVFAAGGETPPETIPGLPGTWPHADTVDGWGGDRVNMYEGPNGAWIIDWHTAWDSEADADQFEARVTELQTQFDGPAQVTGSGSEVRVVIASDQQTLDGLSG